MASADRLPPAVLKRKAVVYIRQSTQAQVQTNFESRRRQYELVDDARQRGFHNVEVIDDDLGRSASLTALQEQTAPTTTGTPERPYQPADQTAVEEVGTVKWYNPGKGFGFIVRDPGGKDIFIDVSALNRASLADLVQGLRVTVDMVGGRKGPEAFGVRLV